MTTDPTPPPSPAGELRAEILKLLRKYTFTDMKAFSPELTEDLLAELEVLISREVQAARIDEAEHSDLYQGSIERRIAKLTKMNNTKEDL